MQNNSHCNSKCDRARCDKKKIRYCRGKTGPTGARGPSTTINVDVMNVDETMMLSGPIPISDGDSLRFVSNSLDISVTSGSAIVRLEIGSTGLLGDNWGYWS